LGFFTPRERAPFKWGFDHLQERIKKISRIGSAEGCPGVAEKTAEKKLGGGEKDLMKEDGGGEGNANGGSETLSSVILNESGRRMS